MKTYYKLIFTLESESPISKSAIRAFLMESLPGVEAPRNGIVCHVENVNIRTLGEDIDPVFLDDPTQ